MKLAFLAPILALLAVLSACGSPSPTLVSDPEQLDSTLVGSWFSTSASMSQRIDTNYIDLSGNGDFSSKTRTLLIYQGSIREDDRTVVSGSWSTSNNFLTTTFSGERKNWWAANSPVYTIDLQTKKAGYNLLDSTHLLLIYDGDSSFYTRH